MPGEFRREGARLCNLEFVILTQWLQEVRLNPTIKVPERLPSAPVLEGLACLNFSQAIIAEQVGVPQPKVSRWYRGETRMNAAEIFVLTALLDLAVRTADEGQNSDDLSETTKRILEVRSQVARTWLSLQEEMNQDLPSESRELALALYARRIELLKAKPRHRRVAAQW